MQTQGFKTKSHKPMGDVQLLRPLFTQSMRETLTEVGTKKPKEPEVAEVIEYAVLDISSPSHTIRPFFFSVGNSLRLVHTLLYGCFHQGTKLNSGWASDSVSSNHNSPLKASCHLSY